MTGGLWANKGLHILPNHIWELMVLRGKKSGKGVGKESFSHRCHPYKIHFPRVPLQCHRSSTKRGHSWHSFTTDAPLFPVPKTLGSSLLLSWGKSAQVTDRSHSSIPCVDRTRLVSILIVQTASQVWDITRIEMLKLEGWMLRCYYNVLNTPI